MGLIGKHNFNNFNPQYLSEIKNFTFDDLRKVGNIVKFKDNSEIYHGIVIDSITSNKIFNRPLHNIILTPTKTKRPRYWNVNTFLHAFPKFIKTEITNIYHLSIDISKLNDIMDFYNLFERLNLSFTND